MNWRQYLKLWFITCSGFTYLSREEKCKNYGHTPILQALATDPVTEPGTGDRAWNRFRYRIEIIICLPKAGKDDYYNPKSNWTITLALVPLKWMERVILWHMKIDIKIYSNLRRRKTTIWFPARELHYWCSAQISQEVRVCYSLSRNGTQHFRQRIFWRYRESLGLKM